MFHADAHISPITSEKEHALYVRLLDALLDIVGTDTKHGLAQVLNAVGSQVDIYERKNGGLSE